MSNEAIDEISLRDVYLIIKKHLRLIMAFTVGAAVLTLIVTLILPKSYSSQVIFNLAVNADRPEFKSLPNAIGLSQGFIQLVSNESLAATLQEERLESIFKAKFDDKKTLLTLTAYGTDPEMALARAKKFQAAALDYFENQVSSAVRTNINATLAQTKVDIASSTDNLKRIEPLLNNTRSIQNNTADTAALESRGVDPQLARANNPALVSLALQISQLRVGLASQQAKYLSLETIMGDPKAFSALLGQGFQAQVLAAPALALSAESPKPGLTTALATVAGLLLGLVGAFVLEALRPEIAPARSSSLRLNTQSDSLPRANPGD